MKKRLIPLMLATSVSLSLATLAGCTEKSEEEKNAENEIRKLLEYDANINIDKTGVESYGFRLETNITEKRV